MSSRAELFLLYSATLAAFASWALALTLWVRQ